MQEEDWNLYTQSRERVKEIFHILKTKNKNISSYIMVVDKSTVKIISKLFKMNELVENGIDTIEKLEITR